MPEETVWISAFQAPWAAGLASNGAQGRLLARGQSPLVVVHAFPVAVEKGAPSQEVETVAELAAFYLDKVLLQIADWGIYPLAA